MNTQTENFLQWTNLLSTRRPKEIFQKNTNPDSSNTEDDFLDGFEKDYYTIIGNSYFRRLQDKTQVYTLDDSDFIRTRLTHSIEVSAICEILGHKVGKMIRQENSKLVQPENLPDTLEQDIPLVLRCAGLLHDIGNPPFGHTVEAFICNWFDPDLRIKQELRPLELSEEAIADLTHFDGNVQNQRIVLRHGQDSNPDGQYRNYGMNLTCAVIGSILKYPYSSQYATREELRIAKEKGKKKKRKKIGYFHVDQWIVEAVQKELGTLAPDAPMHTCGKRNPLMLLLEAADDIAYGTADLEDSVKKGTLPLSDALLFFPKEVREAAGEDMDFKTFQQMLKTARERSIDEVIVEFGNQYSAIMSGNYEGGLVKNCSHNYKDKTWDSDAQTLDKIMTAIYIKRDILCTKFHHTESYIGDILNDLVDAVLDEDTPKDSPKKKMLRKEMDQFLSKAKLEYNRDNEYILSHENHPRHYKDGSPEQIQNRNYYLMLSVIDFVSGMTDGYVELFAHKIYHAEE